MTLPKGWLPNTRPGECATEYTGDPTDTWEAGADGNPAAPGAQPRTDANPDGTVGSIPVMSLGGPQR